jgi:hypothetical protein
MPNVKKRQGRSLLISSFRRNFAPSFFMLTAERSTVSGVDDTSEKSNKNIC